MSWGQIYCETYWGKRSQTTLSIQNEAAIACFAPANDYVDQFTTRLEADGGSIEAVLLRAYKD
jgi:hypothetical protein